ncbi:hypothetical protein AK973_2438 [Pseudomonas brassicacearum]|nr:hypothetical protein AK973_2438 [Pseudomonas brassicacearum]
MVKQRSRWFFRVLDGGPTIVVEDGRVLAERLKHSRLATMSDCALPHSNRNATPGQGSP